MTHCEGFSTNVWSYRFNERCPDDFWVVPFWWERLLEDPNFVAQVQERWNTLRGGAFADGAILSKIDTYENVLTATKASDKNFDRWDILGIFVPFNDFVGETYKEENDYLKNWISSITSWLDTAINAL